MQTQYISGNRDNRSRQRGSALMVVLGLVLLMGLITTIMSAMTGQAAYRVKKTLEYSSSLAIAEGGVADVIDIMNTNYAAGVGTTYTKDLGGGSYTVKTEHDAASGNIVIASTGTAEISRVLRVAVSKVRIPRSQRITRRLPSERIYSALIKNS